MRAFLVYPARCFPVRNGQRTYNTCRGDRQARLSAAVRARAGFPPTAAEAREDRRPDDTRPDDAVQPVYRQKGSSTIENSLTNDSQGVWFLVHSGGDGSNL